MNNGAFGENFPYSNFHDLNMDWIVKIVKDFLDQYTELNQTIEDGNTQIENTTSEGVTQIENATQTAVEEFSEQATEEANRVIGTIPSDYTTLSQNALQSSRSIINDSNLTETVASGNLNDLPMGIYYCNELATATNQPFSPMNGTLIIFKYHPSRTSGICQVFYSTRGTLAYRNSHGATTIWDDWTLIDMSNLITSSGDIVTNSYIETLMQSDFNNLNDPQSIYYCANITEAENQPIPTMNGMLMVLKFKSDTDAGTMQIYYDNNGETYYRIKHGGTPTWDWWHRIGYSLNDMTCKIFKKVVCCGDSYMSGYMVDTENNVNRYRCQFSMPHYMETLTGNEWINCGVSGATSKSWLTDPLGLEKAKQAGKAQAYILALMLNDAGASGIPVGTTSDIGTENDTYYAQYSKCIRELATISPTAYIFLCTVPQTSTTFTSYNEAVRTIYETYMNSYNVHLLDLNKHINLYSNKSLSNDRREGHYTAMGYEQFSEIFAYIMSQYINSNVDKFINVSVTPYTPTPSREAIESIINANSPSNITAPTSYIKPNGKYAVVNGKVYFSVMVEMLQNVSSGLNNIFAELPTPANTNITFEEYDISMTENDNYLSYTTAFRINGRHTAGDFIFYYGSYTV